MHAKDVITIKSDKDFTLETDGQGRRTKSQRRHDDRRQPGRHDQGRQLDHDRGHLSARRSSAAAAKIDAHADGERSRSPERRSASDNGGGAVADIIGTGISFPLRVDRLGGLALSSGDTDVQEAIDIILGTAPGRAADAARVRLRHPQPRLRERSTPRRSRGSSTRSARRSTAGSRGSTSSTSSPTSPASTTAC